jgi:hypothetical protein
MSKRHQYKASGKKTRRGQHQKSRHKERQNLTGQVARLTGKSIVRKKKPNKPKPLTKEMQIVLADERFNRKQKLRRLGCT